MESKTGAKPSEHFYQYWHIHTNDRILHDHASHVLLKYVQDFGQGQEERLNALLSAARYAGFRTVTVERSLDKWGFVYNDKKDEYFKHFVTDIARIQRNNFEHEVVQIADILTKYRMINKKWWQIWK